MPNRRARGGNCRRTRLLVRSGGNQSAQGLPRLVALHQACNHFLCPASPRRTLSAFLLLDSRVRAVAQASDVPFPALDFDVVVVAGKVRPSLPFLLRPLPHHRHHHRHRHQRLRLYLQLALRRLDVQISRDWLQDKLV